MPQTKVIRGELAQSNEKSTNNWGIQDFYALATKLDFARLHQFRIIEWKNNGNSVFREDDYFLYLETASLPGKEITNVVVPYIGMEFNVPSMTKYSGASYPVVFRCDQPYDIRYMLEECLQTTYDDIKSSGYGLAPGEDSYMIIGLLDKNNEPEQKYKLIGTSVNSIGLIQYNTGDTGTVAKVEASLTYHYWQPMVNRSLSFMSSNNTSNNNNGVTEEGMRAAGLL